MEASVLLRSSLTSFTYELIARLPAHCPPRKQQVVSPCGKKTRCAGGCGDDGDGFQNSD